MLNSQAPYRNEDLATITGQAPEGDTVTVTVSGSSSSDECLAIATDGSFSVDVGLERGVDVEVAASNANGSFSPVITHACERWDRYEIDGDAYGDGCSINPVTVSEAFSDIQEISVITGNALLEGDEDWYRVVTVDDPTIEQSFGYENYDFQVHF